MMRGLILERVLRTAAILIAFLGLVDPALTLPWPDRPIVSVVIASPSPHEDRAVGQPGLTPDEARALQARVVSTLARELDARSGPVENAAAIVLIGDGRSPAPHAAAVVAAPPPSAASAGSPTSPASTAPPASTAAPLRSGAPTPGSTSGSTGSTGSTPSLPASRPTADAPRPGAIVAAVVPASAPSGLRIAHIDAPRRAHVSARVPMVVQLDGHGLAGRTFTIVVRSDGLDLARQTLAWPEQVVRRDVALSLLPLRAEPTRFTVDVLEGSPPPATATTTTLTTRTTTTSTTADGDRVVASADVMVDVHDRPLRVAFIDARPSWATRFIRRALEDDARFAVMAATRVSRGVTASTVGAPSSLAAVNLDAVEVLVVGAAELLTKADVDRLRMFARERGGLVVIAPDRRPEGAVLDLLPARDFTERLLTEPVKLVAEADAARDGAIGDATPTATATSNATTTRAEKGPKTERSAPAATRAATAATTTATMSTSELAIAGVVLPGAEVLLRLAEGGSLASATSSRANSSPAISSPAISSESNSSAAISSPHSSAPISAATRPRPSLGVRAVVIASALGEGSIVLSGALDAWRFRDRDDGAFDRFWRETIAARAAMVPDPIEVRLDPAIAAPGDPIRVKVLRRSATATAMSTGTATSTAATTSTSTRTSTATATATDPSTTTAAAASAANVRDAHATTMRALLLPRALAASDLASTRSSTATARIRRPDGSRATGFSIGADADAHAGADAVANAGTPIRLWPAARPSAYDGALNAPSGDGVYAVSVQADDERAGGRALLRVATGGRTTRPAWPGLQAFVEARGGLLVTADHLDILARHLHDTVRPPETRRPRHPLRAAWWIVPFAACLGGEWFLRRRRGER